MNALEASNPVIVVPICATLAVAIPTFISVCAFLGLLNARRVFVELPPERERSDWCGLLLNSMYGEPDAAANFAAIVMETLPNVKSMFGNSTHVRANTQAKTS